MPKGQSESSATCPQSPALSSSPQTEKDVAVLCREERKAKALPSPPQKCGETNPVTDSETKGLGYLKVFVIGKTKSPLMPCHPARARELSRKQRVVVSKLMPFVLRIKDRTAGNTQPIELKLDPGAKTTGLALVTNKSVELLIEIIHRANEIKKSLLQRRGYRRRRRTANLRCRKPRWLNRKRKEGWLPPSLRSIVDNILNWIKRLGKWVPITGITIEHIKFDTQKLMNPEISGAEYQKGTLSGYNIWEYLLEKFNHTCIYCNGKSGDNKLTKDHVIATANGGSNRVSNLVVACYTCNQEKGNTLIESYLAGNPQLLGGILSILKKPLDGAAKVTSIRNSLVRGIQAFGLPITLSTGAETKFNRDKHGIPKTHALDAAFTGDVLHPLKNWNQQTLSIKAQGRGSHQRTKPDRFGFPRLKLPRKKVSYGFKTGDIVSTPKGTGRIAIRSTGHFSLNGRNGGNTVKHNQCRLLQRADGYNYTLSPLV
jgi:5-methylcytosine-specific restriction endonuclease McrA